MFDKTNNIIQSENIDNMVYDGIGFDGIRYIQQTGQKVQGKIYLDKTQPGLWYCLKTTSAINNTSDFTRADSTALLDKLQNLKYQYKSFYQSGQSNTNMIVDTGWIDGLVIVQFLGVGGTQHTVPIIKGYENFFAMGGHDSVSGNIIKLTRVVATESTIRANRDEHVVIHAILRYPI